MKWLFATLLALNIIVFAGMVGNKIMNPAKHNTQTQQQNPTQPQIVINTGNQQLQQPIGGTPTPNSASAAGNAVNKTNNAANANKPPVKPQQPPVKPQQPKPPVTSNETAKANYRNCSARVSLPEDDYHRIKGLLGRFPHAATRSDVADGEGSRINVLFMSVSDQDASTIQGIVGRYGSLNRAPCGK